MWRIKILLAGNVTVTVRLLLTNREATNKPITTHIASSEGLHARPTLLLLRHSNGALHPTRRPNFQLIVSICAGFNLPSEGAPLSGLRINCIRPWTSRNARRQMEMCSQTAVDPGANLQFAERRKEGEAAIPENQGEGAGARCQYFYRRSIEQSRNLGM